MLIIIITNTDNCKWIFGACTNSILSKHNVNKKNFCKDLIITVQ